MKITAKEVRENVENANTVAKLWSSFSLVGLAMYLTSHEKRELKKEIKAKIERIEQDE
jgi:hypothetical protein